MSTDAPRGWREVEKSVEGLAGTIVVSHRPDGIDWVDVCRRFWLGGLEGLALVHESPVSQVFRAAVSAGSALYYFKRMPPRGLRDRLRHALGGSRARRAAQGAERIARRGLLTPRVACVSERRRFGIAQESVLVTEAVDGGHTLLQLLRDPALGIKDSTRPRWDLIRRVGRAVGRWHAAGLVHGDMRWGNLSCGSVGGEMRVYWLDNERTSAHATVPFRLRIQNLAQMALPPDLTWTERLRFWKEYRAETGLSESDERRVLRAVLAELRRRWNKRGWTEPAR